MHSQVIKGSVSDEQGEPIPFSKVWLKNTSSGTIANGKGVYHLDVRGKGKYDLRISSIGYESIDTSIVLSGDVLIYNIILPSSVLQLEEVVVSSESNKKKGKSYLK